MPPLVQELIGRYLDSVKQLGQRTAELHRALAVETRDPAFVPENSTPLYQRSLYQSMRNVQQRAMLQLLRQLQSLPEDVQQEAHAVLVSADQMLRRFQSLVSRRTSGKRIRCHGNLSLGELLFTGKDFVIVDFEGEPGRSLGERRVKRSALSDVATMIRSFHHAAAGTLLGDGHRRGRTPGMIRPEDISLLEQWAATWYAWIATTFTAAYREHSDNANYLPAAADEFDQLLTDFLLERALRELSQALHERPAWAPIALRAVLQLVGEPQPSETRSS
jgi:maltose alpha-D-glucosyltransferase/alpha-amylase